MNNLTPITIKQNTQNATVNSDSHRQIKTMRSASDVATDYGAMLLSRAEGEKHYKKSGLSDLDKQLGGWLHDGHLVVIAARPGMGKTALSQQIAENVALDTTAIFYTLEMSSYELAERSVARETGISVQLLKTAEIEKEEDWSSIGNAIVKFGNLKMLIDDGTFDIASLVNKSMAAAKALKNDGEELGLIVVDYLQLISGAKNAATRTLEVGQVITALKRLSKELSVPVIVLSQLNRDLEKRQDKRPIMTDLRDSGQIEQDADLILFIYRDEIYNDNSPDKGIAEIIAAKNRHGPTGMTKMAFVGNRVMFGDLAHCEPVKNVVSMKKKGRSHEI